MTGNIIKLLIISALFLSGCGRDRLAENNTLLIDSASLPDSEFSGATIQLTSRGVETAEIRADRIRRFDMVDSTMAYVLDIDFFDSLGQVSSNLVGDSGIIREVGGDFEVFGKVIVLAQDSVRLETDYLRWNQKTQKIRTDAYVKLTAGDNVTTGWGMEADPDLGRLEILSQVSGSGAFPESEN